MNMDSKKRASLARVILLMALASTLSQANAATSPEEAQKLKTVLTPAGAERNGNKEGTIPEWKGGLTTPTPGFINGGRRPDPFAGEKPLFSITAQNAAQYKDKLTPGVQAMLAKYPSTYRLDVYPTHRTAAMPEVIYQKTFKNATSAKVVMSADGKDTLEGYNGGVPFPIPKSGIELAWNSKLSVTPPYYRLKVNNYLLQADGRRVLVSALSVDFARDFGSKTSVDSGNMWQLVRSVTNGPPIRVGEGIIAWSSLEETSKSSSWVYLPGQRRVRKLPNPCCDTPTPFSSGLITFDELQGLSASFHKFDWKIVGKKEIYVPYNSNRTLVPARDADVLGERHLNPDHVRWELHRVWVLEAQLKQGERHVSPRGTYYLDEDTWIPCLVERYDAQGTLSRTGFNMPIAMPDVPVVMTGTWGWYDLIGGSAYIANIYNEQSEQMRTLNPLPFTHFQPESMAAEEVR